VAGQRHDLAAWLPQAIGSIYEYVVVPEYQPHRPFRHRLQSGLGLWLRQAPFRRGFARHDPDLLAATSNAFLFGRSASYAAKSMINQNQQFRLDYFAVFSVFWLLKPDRFVPNIRPWFI
jgi:hypothetical protein